MTVPELLALDRHGITAIMQDMHDQRRTSWKAVAVRATLVVAAAAGLAAPGGRLPEPRITIHVERGDVAFDDTHSHQDLKSMAQCERPATTGKYLGLSRATLATRFTSKVAARPEGEGYTGGVITMDVTLKLSDRTVYVASEFPRGSCSFEETLDHEMRHVEIDDALGDLFRQRIAKAFHDILPAVTGISGPTPQAIKNTIQARMDVLLEREMRALRAERLDRQSAVDSSEEYKRLGDSCGGETERLIRAAEAGDAGWHSPVPCPNV